MLEELASYGLVKKTISDEGETRYTTSVRGLDFLETYWKMNAFLETFEGTQTRELVAIMFTDIEGFTGLAQRNEREALRLLQEHEKVVRGLVSRFNGREVKTIGDAFLIEFASALKACECAIELQRTSSRKSESGWSESAVTAIRLRIGIHIGDVERRGTDIVGDAVNIASRIQNAAKPNEILISRQVFDQVWNKLGSHITELGNLEAKNLQLPLQVFRIDEYSDGR
jgi:class 3 adenylate cyclase